MSREKSIDYLKTLDLKVFKHASNIVTKNNNWTKLSTSQKMAFPIILEQYLVFYNKNLKLIGYSDKIISQRTILLNNYYNFLKENNYDNIFTSQSKFRSTIIEEFMYILFKDLIENAKTKINGSGDNLKIGSARAYTNLFFSGINFYDFINEPKIGINQKDQDFAIYRPINIAIGNSNNIETNLPIIAIENKTYLDKTMLEGSIATAEKIKSGNPYSLYFIVTENYDVDLRIDPAYSKINQIYVLRKGKKKGELLPIYADVLIDLVKEVKTHLTRNWSDVENKMTKEGKII